ncbi:MAG: polysaccharide biosynthesis protein [Bacteroidales bacterium]|nr:polysaccharide biosynthesis protein [Bacteroidales bacterium]
MADTFLYSRLSKYLSHYASPKLILLLDVGLSVLASAVVLLLIRGILHVFLSAAFFVQYVALATVWSVVAFVLTSSYRGVIRHMNARDGIRLIIAVAVKVFLLGLTWYIVGKLRPAVYLTLSLDAVLTFGFLVFFRYFLLAAYDFYRKKLSDRIRSKRVLVYGISEKSIALLPRFRNSPHYEIVGFLVPGKKKEDYRLAGCQVYAFEQEEDIQQIITSTSMTGILFAKESDAASERERLVNFATQLGLEVLITPGAEQFSNRLRIRNINIEDLLERAPIRISTDVIASDLAGKTVLVTGAAGSIGSQLCRQIASFNIRELILFDNAETPMHNLRLELEEKFPSLSFVPIIGDVRMAQRLDDVFSRWHPQVVFHAAAYKHVPLMEENPCEAVMANVCGSRNVADKCVEYGAEKMVMISTDKAVNPTNVMGCTKRLAEIYVQSLGLLQKGKTRFVTTRFGNVLGSNGSVIPRFREQIAQGGPVTVTDPRINRFFMTIPEACSLVLEAANLSEGNDIFVFDMGESVKIDVLARRMIELAGYVPDVDIKIEYTGLRPGEKLYEEVLSNEENTLPTPHERIRVARVREYSYEQADRFVNRMRDLAIEGDVPSLIKLMKEVVPEYVSQNSVFEAYDKK